MERPISPTCITDLEQPEIINNDNIEIEEILLLARNAFSYIKNKTNKNVVTCGDALLEFYNYNDSDEVNIYSLYCLSKIMLNKIKSDINNIADGSYDKISTYTDSMYYNKIQS